VDTGVLSREEQQEQTREALLDSARDVFARRGYHEAKLAEVARNAGFTTGAVYSNFEGKEGLFLAVADREMDRRIEIAENVVDVIREAEDLNGALVSTFDAAISQSPESVLLFFEFWAYFARRGETAPAFQERRDRVRTAIAAALEADAEKRGRRLVRPATEIASALRGVLNGLGFERAVDRGEFPQEPARWAITALLEAASEPSEPAS
jgi:AcrR family transcriptional regulator